MLRRIELEERYGVTTPITDHVRALTDRYYRGLELLQALDEPTSIEALATVLDVDVVEVRERVAYLAEFDRAVRDGETVRPVA